jgi:hypothetical protein
MPALLLVRDQHGERIEVPSFAAHKPPVLTNQLCCYFNTLSVVIVTDHSICSTASAAFDKELVVSASSEAPIVLKLGTQWAVVKHLGFRHFRPNVIFNSTFTTAVARIWY